MLNDIIVKDYSAPEIDRKEIFRYASIKGNGELEYGKVLDEVLSLIKDKLIYKVCYGVFSININKDIIDFGFASCKSKDLSTHLMGSKKVVVFASTIGVEIDRLIAKYSLISPSKALFLQAIGTERVEALCDCFSSEIKEQALSDGLFTTTRFSPGYGDLELGFQRKIFKALSLEKRIMLTLNDSLIMSPIKSVTAIIGIKGDCDSISKDKCKGCKKTDCVFRS